MMRPFTPAVMVKFRKRFNAQPLAAINERILQTEKCRMHCKINKTMIMNDDWTGSGRVT
jgi:hypothetical protein